MTSPGHEMEGVRVVIGMQESPVQIFTTNYLLDHLPVHAVLLERPRRKRSNRPMALLRRLGLRRGAARILDLVYLKLRARTARIAQRERELLFPDGAPVALRAGAPVHEVVSINSKRARKLMQDLGTDILVINGTSKGMVIKFCSNTLHNLLVINLGYHTSHKIVEAPSCNLRPE